MDLFMSAEAPDRISELVAQIVAAYVSHNSISALELPGLINAVRGALNGIVAPAAAPAEKPVPAVSPRKSVFPDYIVCLEDGRKLKMLRRHLKAAYGMTAEEYRARWDLPADYPMVAPNYANQRSELARQIGLGTRPG